MTARYRRRAGFTLLEVLIAMAITALVATLSFSSISAVLSSVAGWRASSERISALNRAWTIISRDIEQFVPRPVRDAYGETESALWGNSGRDSVLNFTRAGWHNPNQVPRSQLQRLRYRLADTVLWRDSYAVLDRTEQSEPQSVPLLSGVQEFTLAFLEPDLVLRGETLDTDGWPDRWDIEKQPPPQALEIRLLLDDWGELRWLYELPESP